MILLYGPAGARKSAITQTVVECYVDGGMLFISFFFVCSDPRRNQGKHFCVTLAAQMYNGVPETRPLLQDNIRRNQAESLDLRPNIQFRELVAESLRALPPSTMNVVVIIDRLNERHKSCTQNGILSVGSTLQTSPSLPARFLIARRPKPNIRKTFDHVNLRNTDRSR